MSELNKFEALKKKLEGICDENNLCFSFRKDTYPITLTISPCGGVNAQMTMLELAEDEGFRSPDASIVFYCKDGDLSYKLSERFTISDALFSKIRNLYRKMMTFWCQHFFRFCIERNLLSEAEMPRISNEDANGKKEETKSENEGTNLPEGAEPIEEVAEDEDPDSTQAEADGADVAPEETLSANAHVKNKIIDFAKDGCRITCSRVSSLLNMTLSGASRILGEMEEEGTIRRNPITGGYELVADESFGEEDESNE